MHDGPRWRQIDALQNGAGPSVSQGAKPALRARCAGKGLLVPSLLGKGSQGEGTALSAAAHFHQIKSLMPAAAADDRRFVDGEKPCMSRSVLMWMESPVGHPP